MEQLILLEKELYGEGSFDLVNYYVLTFVAMGFDEKDSTRALETADNDFNLALHLLLNPTTSSNIVKPRVE